MVEYTYSKVDTLIKALENKGLDDTAIEVAEIFSSINSRVQARYLDSNINGEKRRHELYVQEIAPYALLLI